MATVSGRAQALDRISNQTNWRTQGEHGGFYQAAAPGTYRKHGIECDLRTGGPQQNPAQPLLADRVDAIMPNSLQALNYGWDGLLFMAVAATFQKDPQGFMVHQGHSHASFKALIGLACPDRSGRVWNRTQGHRRASAPGHVDVSLRATCAAVPSRHALRAPVAGACFPACPVNPGAGGLPHEARAEDGRGITLRIGHSSSTASHVSLPAVVQPSVI